MAALLQYICPLLDRGIIEKRDHTIQNKGLCTNMLLSKKVGGFCPILDLRGLNWFLKVQLFNMLRFSGVIHGLHIACLSTAPAHRCFSGTGIPIQTSMLMTVSSPSSVLKMPTIYIFERSSTCSRSLVWDFPLQWRPLGHPSMRLRVSCLSNSTLHTVGGWVIPK